MKSLYLFRGLSCRCIDFSSGWSQEITKSLGKPMSYGTSQTKSLFSLGRGSNRESSVVGGGRRGITEVVSGVGNWGMGVGSSGNRGSGVGGGDKGGSSVGGGGNGGGSVGSNWSSHSNGRNRLNVDISLSWDLGINVGLSSNLLMDIRLSGDLGINVGFSLNVFMDVSLGSGVEVGISYRWVIDSSIDSSIDSRGSSVAIVGSDWCSGVGGSNWGSGVGGSSKRGNTVVGYRGSSSVSIGLGVSIGGGSIHLSFGISGDRGHKGKNGNKGFHFSIALLLL